jgi:hypothetical protein
VVVTCAHVIKGATETYLELPRPNVEDRSNSITLGAESKWKVLTEYDIAFRFISLPKGAAASSLRLNVTELPVSQPVSGQTASASSVEIRSPIGDDVCSAIMIAMEAEGGNSGMLLHDKETNHVLGFLSAKISIAPANLVGRPTEPEYDLITWGKNTVPPHQDTHALESETTFNDDSTGAYANLCADAAEVELDSAVPQSSSTTLRVDPLSRTEICAIRWEHVYLRLKEHLGIAERVDVIAVCPIEYVYTLAYLFIWLSVVSTAPNQSDHTTKTTNAGKTHDVSPHAQEWFVRM